MELDPLEKLSVSDLCFRCDIEVAQHVTTGQKVAMKIMNKKKMTNMELGVRVKREIQYLKLLRHPHIIKLYGYRTNQIWLICRYEVLTTPTEIVMVMEYAGGELFNYIVEKGKMTEDEARQFFQQIISAIEYCHRHNITQYVPIFRILIALVGI